MKFVFEQPLVRICMRLGIFGGSFDPIHNGHLILAEQCREQANLDKVLLLPAAQSPLKDNLPNANDRQRLEMLSLAIAGHTDFEISKYEIERGGNSYTVDTLEHFSQEDPESQLFLMIGEDSLDTFFRWKDPRRICQLATPLVVRRPGTARNSTSKIADLSVIEQFMDDDQYSLAQELAIESRLIDISSTDIRERTSQEKSIRYLVPRAVEKYIETNQLYLAKEDVEV